MMLIFFIKYHNHLNFFFYNFDVDFFKYLRTTIFNYKEQTMLLPFKKMQLENRNHLTF